MDLNADLRDGARGGRAARGRRGASALRPRAARPRRPQPVGHRGEGRAGRAPARSAIRSGRPSTSPTSRTSRGRRSEEVREAVSGYRQPTLVDELAGARMALSAAGIDADLRGADVAAAARRRGGARLDRARGHDERHPPQRREQLPDRRRAGARGRRARRSSTTATPTARPTTPGNGLAGLRERAEQLAGASRPARRRGAASACRHGAAAPGRDVTRIAVAGGA